SPKSTDATRLSVYRAAKETQYKGRHRTLKMSHHSSCQQLLRTSRPADGVPWELTPMRFPEIQSPPSRKAIVQAGTGGKEATVGPAVLKMMKSCGLCEQD